MITGIIAASLLLVTSVNAFIPSNSHNVKKMAILLSREGIEGDGKEMNESNRRSFLLQGFGSLIGASLISTSAPRPASAQVYFDPAVYGDQELRQSAVNSLKESVRRAILQDPSLVLSFYQLAILDGLSFDSETTDFGPDGRVLVAIQASKNNSPYMTNLKKCCDILLKACISLKKLTNIGIADAIALGGVAAIESVGGPSLSVQLGRTDSKLKKLSPLNIMVLSGEVPNDEVANAFRRSGLTDREMTAILGCQLTLEKVQKSRSSTDWKASAKGMGKEPGKMARASEFKPLSTDDLYAMENESMIGDDEPIYIAESFGTREESFGSKIGKDDINEKTFNKFLKELYASAAKKGGSPEKKAQFGWIGNLLLDKDRPTTETWVSKYAGSFLSYNRDLSVAYNAITQLGAEFTGGKYENLLKDRKRRVLED